ncbi:MAG: uroporphyrinogen-III C-methyltransferase [Lachnospiraceae bacterium]
MKTGDQIRKNIMVNEMKTVKGAGKVWLVGAGPSDAGLFTLKGHQVLTDAEVVVYDALVGPTILAMIPDTAEAINVGKRSSNHTMRQEQISELLAERAKEGKRVVRLKSGDPFLFGRGGEELEVLIREGILYEVVPGVTSAISVPAYQGIPVTHRDYCSSVHIITGHKREGEACDIDFEALVRTRGTLTYFWMDGSIGIRDDLPRGTACSRDEEGYAGCAALKGYDSGTEADRGDGVDSAGGGRIVRARSHRQSLSGRRVYCTCGVHFPGVDRLSLERRACAAHQTERAFLVRRHKSCANASRGDRASGDRDKGKRK